MQEFNEKVLKYLEEREFPKLGHLLKEMNPADVAELYEELPEESMALVFRLLPKELAADAFAYMEPDVQTVLIEKFSDRELHYVINELYLDDAVDMIEEMPANLVHRILKNLDELLRKNRRVIIRTPVIPGYNDGDELHKIRRYCGERGLPLELLTYHTIGETKRSALKANDR